MHQIGVVGLSYRHVGVDEVARFALPKADVAARLPALRDLLRASEILYVGTCNRVEVLFATNDGSPAGDSRRDVFRALTGHDPQPGEATRILRAWTGEAAVEHLFLVACGLDSAQTGEHEIAIQLRGAWEAAREAHASGPILDRLLGEALGMANRVHRLEAGVRAPSLADLAADRAVLHLAGKPGTVALVGVSPMTKRCGRALHKAGVPLLVVNRTLEAAEEYAQTVGGQALSLLFTTALSYGRMSVAWGCVGITRACLNAATTHARRREQSGKALAEHQLIARHLAGLLVAERVSTQACEHASRCWQSASPEMGIAAVLAKHVSAGHAAESASTAVQVLGSAGASDGHVVARAYRDAKLMEIIEGSNEICQLILAQHALTANRPGR